MTFSARLVLKTALTLPAALNIGAQDDGRWSHYATSMGDGFGRFFYDHPDGLTLIVNTHGGGAVTIETADRAA